MLVRWWNCLTPARRELVRAAGLVLAIFALGLLLGQVSSRWQEVPYCRDFENQAQAQAYYRERPIRGARLDADGDGLACEGHRPPMDLTPVARRAPT